MRSVQSVGHVRGLAVAVGVGFALLATCGVATADTDSSDSSRQSGRTSAGAARSGADQAAPDTGNAADSGRRATRGATSIEAPRAAASRSVDTAEADDIPAVIDANDGGALAVPHRARSSAVSARTVEKTPTVDSSTFAEAPAPAAAAADSTPPTAAQSVAAEPAAATAEPAEPDLTPDLAPEIAPDVTQGWGGLVADLGLTAADPSPALEQAALPPVDDSSTAAVVALALTAVLHMGVVMALAAISAAPPSPFTAISTLHVNGVDIVANSTEEITSLYGRWTYFPGATGMLQSKQQFDVIDASTDGVVGTLGALVTRATGFGYTAMLVTSNDGANVGTEAGQVPPVGSLIAHLDLGGLRWTYTAMPTASGDLVSFTITTPAGEIPVAVTFDAAAGVAARTVDNRPTHLGNGYSIAPADPSAETLTGISGVLPLFTTVQGHQVFNIYDSDGTAVGSFNAVFTTTSDIMGTYTQAILVTGNDGVNVGTEAGQVPPVGTVYNVIYMESDDHFYLYSSMPSDAGSQVSVIQVRDGNVTSSAITLIDASTPPVTSSWTTADGYRFEPASELVPSGINGLPPRDVQVQGYQQFDVYDSAGEKLGTVDADVSSQWDVFGIYSRTMLITGIGDGSTGDVPPVGSVFNFVTSGTSGYGAAHSTVPLESGVDLTSFKLVTPLGDIQLPSTQRDSAGRTPVVFYSPFANPFREI